MCVILTTNEFETFEPIRVPKIELDFDPHSFGKFAFGRQLKGGQLRAETREHVQRAFQKDQGQQAKNIIIRMSATIFQKDMRKAKRKAIRGQHINDQVIVLS